MRKLTIKDLAPYLPWGVECSYLDGGGPRRTKAILTGCSTQDGIETTYRRKRNGCSGDYIQFEGHNNAHDLEFKLHLRPLPDLIREIEHKGKRFIALLNLYCLSTRFNDPDPNQFDCRQLTKEKTFFGSTYTCTRMLHSDANPCLMFSSNRGFYSYDNFGDMGSMREVADQYQLWQKLFEWHFDVNGLIPAGLAQELKTK